MKNLNIRTSMRIWGKNMNKKILLGSILSVVILILVSFTSVIGYQSTSNTKVSPLFNIRTSRAIDEKSEELSCEYVGKGEEYRLSIPKWNSRELLYQQVIDYIHKMDDVAFNKFISLVIYKIQHSSEFKDVNIEKIIIIFNQLRNQPEKNDMYHIYNRKLTIDSPPILCFLLGWFLVIIGGITVIIFGQILSYLAGGTCVMNPHICPPP